MHAEAGILSGKGRLSDEKNSVPSGRTTPSGREAIMEKTEKTMDLWTDDPEYASIVDLGNLHAALVAIAPGKWGKGEFQGWWFDREERLVDLHNRLVWDEYRPGCTVDFFIREPKLRGVARPLVEDRIVQSAVMRILLPRFMRVSSPCSFACMKDRGTLAAAMHWQKAMRSAIGRWGRDWYIVYGDFHHYYQTIDTSVLKRLNRMRITSSERTNRLLDMMMDSYVELAPSNPLFEHEGLPIGNEVNQHEANLYASILDFFVTDELGYGRMYTRYMDDFRLAVHTRDEAREVLTAIDEVVTTRMHQTLSPKKTGYRRFSGKDDFLGHVVCPHHLEAMPEKMRRHERRMDKKMRMHLEGVIPLQELADTVHGAVDYALRTGRHTRAVDRAVLFLVTNGIRTDDFMEYGRGGKAER